MATKKTILTSGLSGILAPDAMSTIELLNRYAKYIEEHAIQGERGEQGVQGVQGEQGVAGKNALIAGYVFSTTSTPDTITAPKSAFNFSREPEIDETFFVVMTNTENGDCYVCIADVISIEEDEITASVESYATISSPKNVVNNVMILNLSMLNSPKIYLRLYTNKEISSKAEFIKELKKDINLGSGYQSMIEVSGFVTADLMGEKHNGTCVGIYMNDINDDIGFTYLLPSYSPASSFNDTISSGYELYVNGKLILE